MATGDLGRNLTFPIFNSDGTAFNDLVLHKATYDSVVMSLGDKITGDVYYRGTNLAVTMGEYVEYEGVKFVLVSPPTIVREGMVSDNSELKGLTKYSFTFYHPMYMLANFPFSDVAVSNDQKKYLSENKSFSWIGNLSDYVAKINKNIASTEWYCAINDNVDEDIISKLSDVLTFDNQSIADALKTGYETWEIPYTISTKVQTISGVQKKFLIEFGLPTTQIRKNNQNFVFEYGQGVGLKNNSRTPRNNKIITRIAGYGSEDNIPYGYPQIVWTGNQSWDYTINNDSTNANSYPIYDGIVGGQKVRLIKHPFTRTHLMPTVYVDAVNKKVNPNATGYNPNIELKDYYDAISGGGYTYPNPIVANAPSYEIHEFDKIKPELGSKQLVSVSAYDEKQDNSMSMSDFLSLLDDYLSESEFDSEKIELSALGESIQVNTSDSNESPTPQTRTPLEYTFAWSFSTNGNYTEVTYESSRLNFTATVRRSEIVVTPTWDDTMDDEGNYVQSYFKLTLPSLGFDLYACAAITQEMSINMRSGACIGCTFPIQVDWDDYKRNFYDEDGNFDPVIGTGHPRDGEKYPNSTSSSITVIVKKENTTFGTLMPNIYQQPATGDQFVILGISLPTSYITDAQERLDDDMKQYMLDNNVHYFDYPLKFDEYFLAQNTDILTQMKPNVVVQFKYNDETLALYIKQMTVKYGDKPLPEYNITLTDDVEIVLNPIGRVSDEVSNIKLLMGEGGGLSFDKADKRYLRKDVDDTAVGLIRLIRGLQVGDRFVTGLLGEGGIFRKEADGTTYLECDKMYVRMKAYFDTVEIRRYMHSGGNRIASAAGIKCTRVEYIDSNGSVTNDVSEAVKFRCYFNATDNDRTITNDFVVGDQAYCHETNVDTSSVDMHHYWRLVVAKSSTPNDNGEHWIDLANYYTNGLPSNMQWTNTRGETVNHKSHKAGSDVPIAQDDIIQLGSADDTTRMGAIIEFVTGADAPSYQIFQNIDDYSLEGKNYVSMGYASGSTSTHGEGHAYLEVYGDFFFGAQPDSVTGESPTFIKYLQDDGTGHPKLDIKANVEFTSPESTYGTSTLDAFIDAITRDIGNIQDQVDGNIESWFYDYMPVEESGGAPVNQTPLVWLDQQHTVPCLPYKTWYDTDVTAGNNNERIKHLGDTFYDNSTGYAFRFSNTGTEQSPVFAWVEITDSAVIKALADAAKAQDTADHKRRVFVAQPAPVSPNNYVEYDVGDLWVNATGTFTYTESGQQKTITYDNDLLRCRVSKPIRDPETHAIINGIFSITDWELASKYTDDSKLLAFLDGYQGTLTAIQGQIDQKAETYYQDDDPSTNQWGSEHVGDMWFCTSDHADPSLYKLGTTWVWQEFINETTQAVTYAWAEAQIPQVVFDTLDRKKAVYVAWGAWVDSDGHNNLELRDLLIPASDITVTINNTQYTFKANRIYRCTNVSTPTFQEVDYVDDQTWSNWIQNTYNDNMSTLNGKIDEKAETWYQNTDPSSSWTTDTEKAKHVGDLWLVNIDVTGSNIYKAGTTWYYKDNGENANPRYTWDKQVVPQEVFDYADGKAAIFVGNTLPTDYHTNDMWFIGDGVAAANLPTGCIAGDVVVSSAESATYNKSHWAKKDRYTDDSKFNGYISQILTGSGSSGDSATVANAIRAIKGALNEGTTIDGGLVLSSFIGLRKNGVLWSGISGQYDESLTTGGIAAWYGGAYIDYETLTDTQKNAGWGTGTNQTRYARSLFRFDGSGYVASGNISWSADGTPSIKGNVVDTTTLKINGTTVNLSDYLPKSAGSSNPLTGDLYSQNILPNVTASSATSTAVYSLGSQSRFWRNLFTKRIYLYKPNANDNDAVYLECDTDHNVKLVGNFYATGAVSALGSNSQQGGTGVTLNQPLSAINSAGLSAPTVNGSVLVYSNNVWKYSSNAGIFATSINIAGTASAAGFSATGRDNTYVLLGGGSTSKLKTINGNSIFGEGDIVVSGGGGGNYLPLTGGTITNYSWGQQLRLSRPNGTPSLYFDDGGSNSWYIYPNRDSYNSWEIGSNYNGTDYTYRIIHSGNSIFGCSFNSDGNISIASSAKMPYVRFKNYNNDNDAGYVGRGSSSGNQIQLMGYSGNTVNIGANNLDNNIFVATSGNVGINTDSPSYGLHVNGTLGVANQITSTLATGTAPISVVSTTTCTNLNADLLDGYHASSFVIDAGGAYTGKIYAIGCKRVFSGHDLSDAPTTGWVSGIALGSNWNNSHYQHYLVEVGSRWYATRTYSNGSMTDWNTFAYLSDNVASATKLQNDRTIWGQTFNGSGDISIGQVAKMPYVRFKNYNNDNDAGYVGRGSSSDNQIQLMGYSGNTVNIGANNLGNNIFVATSGNVGINTNSPAYRLHVNGTLGVDGTITQHGITYTNINYITVNKNWIGWFGAGNNSTSTGITLWCNDFFHIATGNDSSKAFRFGSNGYLGIGTTSPSTKLHIKGRVTCEYDSTALGSFCALRGDYLSYFGINSSGYLIFTTGQSGQSTSTVRMSFTPYTATEHYALISHNLRVAGGGNNTSFTDGGYVQIGAIKLAYDSTNNAIKVIKYDGTAANFYATGAVSALGANTSGGSGSGDFIPLSGSSSISGSLTPASGGSYNLGASDKRWNYVYGIYGNFTGSISTTSGTIQYVTSQSITSQYGVFPQRAAVGQSSTNSSYTLYVYGNTMSRGKIYFYIDDSTTINMEKYTLPAGNYLNVNAKGICVNGSTISSDIRKKDVVSYINDLSIGSIANAPIFNFRWKDETYGRSLQVGTSAQYWRDLLPNTVLDMGERGLTLDYNAVSLTAAVITARKVLDHEGRIRLLEVENEALRKEIEQLKKAA